MLSAEEAAARLGALGDDRWIDAARTRITGLERAHRQHAAPFVEPPPVRRGHEALQRHEQRVRTSAAHLDGLGADDLGEVMAALSPGLGPALARWWVDARHHPYQRSWVRFGYRAPQAPELTRDHRGDALWRLLDKVGPFGGAVDPVWLAAWAPFVANRDGRYPDAAFVLDAGRVLAAAIDLGGPAGDEVSATLVEVANGEHPVGMMGRHVIVALLGAARPEGWDHMERMLLAAQRREGLRQTILELADEAHPLAFGQLLDLVLEKDLLRFAATVRAAAVWLGFRADDAVERIPEIAVRLDLLRRCRSDVGAQRDALTSGEAWPTYIGLHAAAMADVNDALTLVDEATGHRSADVRAAAVRLLGNLGVTNAAARQVRMLDDPDTTVAALALALLPYESYDVHLSYGPSADLPGDTFERLERLAGRLPAKPKTAEPIGIETTGIELARARAVHAMLQRRRDRPLDRLLPWTGAMDSTTRWAFARQIGQVGQEERLSGDLRGVLVAMLGDRATSVRQQAVAAMETARLAPDEAPTVEALLTRKASDLRRGCIGLLAKQPPVEVVASAERLWDAGNELQRDAACELLRSVARPVKTKRGSKAGVSVGVWAGADESAGRFALEGMTDRQRELLGDLVAGPADGTAPADGTTPAPGPAAVDAGLGLYDPARRAVVPQPRRHRRPRKPLFRSDTASRIVGALDDLAHAHRDVHLTVLRWSDSSQDVLLADARWLPSGFGNRTAEEEGTGLILPDVFRSWWAERGDDLREEAALDGLRAYAAACVARPRERRGLLDGDGRWWDAHMRKLAGGRNVGQLRYPDVVEHVLSWLAVDDVDRTAVDECLDAIETTAASVPSAVVQSTPPEPVPGEIRRWQPDWRQELAWDPWPTALSGIYSTRPELFSADRLARWFQLLRWFDEPVPGVERRPLPKRLLLEAHARGVATDDVLDRLLHDTHLLKELTRLRRTVDERYPAVLALADRLRIAHPVDLVAGGTWVAWQEQLFVDGRRQPFKQVFRELYNLTQAEVATGPASRRYEGHQIQPRQAMALFGRRGWLTDRDNADVSRVFHRHDVVARVTFVDGFLTPGEVELPTLQAVLFTRRGDYVPLAIDAVPRVVFSETMRDLDLVVSVAHAGGVDPEATASTVEMRSALVRETARLLGLGNVRPVDPHVVIEGALGEYSVHLGSGVVHRRPGGALCIIPVDSQRRGRVFLPFADDDPKTAEILAKVLLLAEDRKIKDPTILEQLHG